MADPGPCTPSHNARRCIMHGSHPSDDSENHGRVWWRVPFSVFLSSHERRFSSGERSGGARASRLLLVCATSQVERESDPWSTTRLSRRRRIIFLSPRCALFRRAHRRVHHPHAPMRPEIRFLLSQSSWKLIGSNKDRARSLYLSLLR